MTSSFTDRLNKSKTIQANLKSKLGWKFKTFNKLEDLADPEKEYLRIETRDHYEGTSQINEEIISLFVIYGDLKAELSKIRAHMESANDSFSKLKQEFVSPELAKIREEASEKVAMREREVQSIHDQLLTKTLTGGLDNLMAGIKRGALLCNEFSILVLFEMLMLNTNEAYTMLNLRKNQQILHSVAVIGMNQLRKDDFFYTSSIERLIENNLDAIVVDLWASEIYPFADFKTNIERLLHDESEISECQLLSHIEVAFHIPKVLQLSSELRRFYPDVYKACIQVDSLIPKLDYSSIEQSFFACDPYTRDDACGGWCEPPRGSTRVNGMTITRK